MSALTRPEYQSDEPSRYAPKWIREGHLRSAEPVARMPRATQFGTAESAADEHATAWPQDTRQEDGQDAARFEDRREPAPFDDRREPTYFGDDQDPSYFDGRREPVSERQDPAFEGDLAIRQMREARAFSPQAAPEPRWKQRQKSPLAMLVRTTVAIGIATAGALVYVGMMPMALPPALQDMFTSLRQTESAAVETRSPVVERPTKLAGRVGEVPYGSEQAGSGGAPNTQTAAPAPNDNVRSVRTVTVAPWPGSTAPQPAPAPATVAAPANVAAAPPAAVPQAAAAQPSVPQGAAAGLVTRQLDHDEIESLIRRGETFILQGDFAAARLTLQRAAEAGSGRAAVTLGATYDPVMLRKVGVVGFRADPALAREWYERAVALGSPEASARISELGKN